MLADELGGKVRFAYVVTLKEERLKETFYVDGLPSPFLIVDGMVYNQHFLQMLYK